jgi:hypothetical protein
LRGNCLLKQLTEGNIEGAKRRGRRCNQLLDKENKNYWNLKEEGLGSLTEELVSEEAMDLPQERICKQ